MQKILIVDDDQNYRYAIREIIDWEEQGFQIADEAINGSQALRLLRKQKFDVVITDMSMPIMNGVEFVKEAQKEFPELIFIALSAYDDFKFVKESLKAGAIDYILKYEMDEEQIKNTISKVGEILTQRRKLQERAELFQSSDIQNREIKHALIYMQEHYQMNITLQTVADHVGLNKNYFSNLFKAETGEKFVPYLNHLRIRQVVEILKKQRRVKNYELAEQVGYQNANYLSKMFKEIMGMTIEEFKRKNYL